MKPTLAIARLTFWEGIRMGIVLVFVLALIGIVLAAPFVLSGDGTLTGRLQNVLSWSLRALSVLLSLATVFLACSTLANEIRDHTLDLVVTKPVSRFQILIGKWIGINLLNLLLLGLCGASIYGFALLIKNQAAVNERDRLKIESVVWRARTGASPKPPAELQQRAEAFVDQKIREGAIVAEARAISVAEKLKELTNLWRTIDPGYPAPYLFEGLRPPSDDAIVQIRFKARGIPIPLNDKLYVEWMFADPQTGAPMQAGWTMTERRSGDIHQFLVRSRVIKDGRAVVVVRNPAERAGRTKIFFEGEDSLQLLYTVGSFEANFVKTLLLIFLQLVFLSAAGLLFGTFVSFPIACLCSFVTYGIGLLWPWWYESIGGNMKIRTDDADPYGAWGPFLRFFIEPIMYVFPNFSGYNGASLLIEGRYIPWTLVGQSAAQMLLLGGLLLLIGWFLLQQREIAEVTV